MALQDVLRDLVDEVKVELPNGNHVIKDYPDRYCKGKGCLIGLMNMVLSQVAKTKTERYQFAAALFRQYPLNSTKELTVAQGVALLKMQDRILDLAKEIGWQITT